MLEAKPVIILGSGGIGKTTLALAVLHDDQVAEKYSQRYFVSCDGITSIDLLLTELAAVLRISPEARDQYLKEHVIKALRNHSRPAILCLDNLETLWEIPKSRSSVEAFLAILTRIPKIVILATMRGTERPDKTDWTPLHSLHPLSKPDTLAVFQGVTRQKSVDQFGEKLLEATGGIPLAVTLLAYLAQNEGETTEAMWNRWQNLGPSFFSRDDGAEDRQLSLNASIHISLSSPRVLAEPSASQVLALLAILPDGLSTASDRIDQLQHHLPSGVNLRNALHVLNKVALIYVNKTVDPWRYQLLPPIRQFVRSQHSNIVLETECQRGLIALYVKLINDREGHMADPLAHAFIRPELLNIHNILLLALMAHMDGDIYSAAICYSDWREYLGLATEDIMLLAVERSREMDHPETGRCLHKLANVYIAKNKLMDAEECLLKAVHLHQRAQDVLHEGDDWHKLGKLYIRTDRLKEAEESLLKAIGLHQQAHHALSEGRDWL